MANFATKTNMPKDRVTNKISELQNNFINSFYIVRKVIANIKFDI